MSATPAPPGGVVPMPPEWAAAREPRQAVYAALLALIAVGLLAPLVLGLVAGSVTAASVVLALSAPMVLALAGIGLHRSRWPGRRTARVGSDAQGHGLVFDYSPGLWRLLLWSTLGIAPLALALLFLGVAGVLTDGLTVDSVVVLALGVLGTGWVAYCTACLLTGRLRRGSLLVSVDGLTNRTWSGELVLPWERVAGVGPVADDGPALRVLALPGEGARWTPRMRLFGGRERRQLPHLVVLPLALDGDAALAAHAVGWYFAHPDERAELATGAAVERVRSGRAVVGHPAFGGAS